MTSKYCKIVAFDSAIGADTIRQQLVGTGGSKKKGETASKRKTKAKGNARAETQKKKPEGRREEKKKLFEAPTRTSRTDTDDP